jgi:hypothetical protein
MTNRSIDVFDLPLSTPIKACTHVHAYLRASNGWYSLFVCPYSLNERDPGIRVYPLSATTAQRIEVCSRFSAKRLAALAADPTVLNEARVLAGME